MRFSCDRSLLQQAVVAAAQAVYTKSAVPALESLLIEAGADICVSGYDLKIGISARLPADVAERGSVLLNAKLLCDIVRRMTGETVTLVCDEKQRTKLRCGASSFDISGIDADEYPELPSVNREYEIELPQETLRAMISQTLFAVSDSEARPVHTGSLFEITGDTLAVVSVDGYRLALRREKLENPPAQDFSFVVPGSALSEINKLASNDGETVTISVGAKHILFTLGSTLLVSRRLEGEFLNYRQAIPQTNSYTVIASRRRFAESVERVSLLINDRLKNPVHCFFQDGVIKLFTLTALGTAQDEFDVDGTAGGLEIGFNNRYLLDALKAIDDDEVKILLNTGVTPCLIVPADDKDNYLYMILPVRLKPGE